MLEPSWELLIALLRQNEASTLAKQCLETILEEDTFGFLPSNLVLTKDMYNIDTVRAEMNDSDTPVEGYDTIVPALAVETAEALYLYGAGKTSIHYTVYTDENTSRMIGILRYIPEYSYLSASDYAEGKVPGASAAHQSRYISDQAKLRSARTREQFKSVINSKVK